MEIKQKLSNIKLVSKKYHKMKEGGHICENCYKIIPVGDECLTVCKCFGKEKFYFLYCKSCADKLYPNTPADAASDAANFGQEVISLFSLINGYQLSYSLSNSDVSEELRDFRNSFENALIEFLNKRSAKAKKFLNLCLDNKQKVFDKDFSFFLTDLVNQAVAQNANKLVNTQLETIRNKQ